MIQDLIRTTQALDILGIPDRLESLEERQMKFFKAVGIRTINGQLPDGQGNIDITTPPLTGFTPGSVLFVGSDTSIAQDNSGLFYDDTLNNLGLGTTTPIGRLTLSSNVSRSYWQVGAGLRIEQFTANDTTSSGTVALQGVNGIYTPTLTATSATTYTGSATFYSQAAPISSTNVTQTNAYNFWIDSGNCRFDGDNTFGTVVIPLAKVHIGGAISRTAWGLVGNGLNVTGYTATDTTSSGTVTSVAINTIGTSAVAASATTTYTNAAQYYIAGQVTAGTNVTITNNYSFWIDSGAARFDGFVGIGITNVANGQLNIGGAVSASSWTTNGISVRIVAATYTDTTSSGTVSSMGIHGVGAPIVNATSVTTFSNAATWYFAGAPTGTGNATVTNGWTIWVDTGGTRLDGPVALGGGVPGGNYLLSSDNSTAFNTGSLVTGAQFDISNSGVGIIYAIYGSARATGTGTTAEAVGLRGKASTLNASGTLTAAKAVLATSPTATGTITTAYGVFIEAQDITNVGTGYGVYQEGTADLNFFGGSVQLSGGITDATNVALGTGTGTKLGTATTQKLGFWNATPIVQPTTAIAAATFVANTSGIVDDTATFDGYTLGQIVKALRNAGLLA